MKSRNLNRASRTHDDIFSRPCEDILLLFKSRRHTLDKVLQTSKCEFCWRTRHESLSSKICFYQPFRRRCSSRDLSTKCDIWGSSDSIYMPWLVWCLASYILLLDSFEHQVRGASSGRSRCLKVICFTSSFASKQYFGRQWYCTMNNSFLWLGKQTVVLGSTFKSWQMLQTSHRHNACTVMSRSHIFGGYLHLV